MNVAHPDGSMTFDNRSVQRLMDYNLLHWTDSGWIVGRWSDAEAAELLAACDDPNRWCAPSPDTHRMAETQNSGSVRSMGSGISSKNHTQEPPHDH